MRLERGSRLINCTVYGNVKSGARGSGCARRRPVRYTSTTASCGTMCMRAAAPRRTWRRPHAPRAAFLLCGCRASNPVSSTTADPLLRMRRAEASGCRQARRASTRATSYNSLLVDLEGRPGSRQTIDMAHASSSTRWRRHCAGGWFTSSRGRAWTGWCWCSGNEGTATAGGRFYSNTVAYNWTGRATRYAEAFSPTCRDYGSGS